MKKVLNSITIFIKKNILGMIIGAAIVGGITLVNADYRFTSTKVYYDKSSSNTYTSKTNVGAALDELYDKAAYGNARPEYILKNQTALVKGSKVTGTMEDNGDLSENLGWNATKTIPAGYTSGGTVKCKAWDANGNYCTTETATFSTETIYPSTSAKTISVATGKYITSGGTKTIPAYNCAYWTGSKDIQKAGSVTLHSYTWKINANAVPISMTVKVKWANAHVASFILKPPDNSDSYYHATYPAHATYENSSNLYVWYNPSNGELWMSTWREDNDATVSYITICGFGITQSWMDEVGKD
jgi:hypothetical protein